MDGDIVARCSTRLAQALAIRGMKQTDLCNKTGIPKSAISQYISGAFEPKQDRLSLIAQALDVDPVWLMGYDVPMEKEQKTSPDKLELTEGEKLVLDLFRRVPEERRDLVLQMIRVALSQQE